ncbi:MAG: hypothetical protein N2690_00120 [Rhodocyclaceae bacterium]|nr:hypothetical protein [Rhodocyclaceae bacterium]
MVRLMYGLLLALLAASLGLIVATLVHRRAEIEPRLKQILAGQRQREASVSLGALPSFWLRSTALKQARPLADAQWVPQDLRPWWSEYLQRFPRHAMALQQTWAIMQANPVPASPYPGGHRGATLLEHSWNVLRTLLAQPWPAYKGIFNKQGREVFALLDAQRRPYEFARHDPLPYLCAFAHDIGKVVCYQPQPDGSAIEIKPEHDTQGKLLLRGLSTWRALPWRDYQAALMAVGWYHKPLQMPRVLWLDDRARALVLLLQHIDQLTGELEAQGHYDAYIARVVAPKTVAPSTSMPAAEAPNEEVKPADSTAAAKDSTPATAVQPQTEECVSAHAIDVAKPVGSQALAQPEADAPAASQAGQPDAPSDDGAAPAAESVRQARRIYDGLSTALDHLSDEEIVQLTADLLLKPGSLGGKTPGARVGYKYGSWVYLYDAQLNDRMRELLCEQRMDARFVPANFVRPGSGQITDYTRRLMLALARRGALKQEHDGLYYSKWQAFFILGRADAKHEGAAAEGPWVIVARAYAFGRSVFNLPDVPRQPCVVRAVFESNALRSREHIEAIQTLMQAWTEPTPALQIKQEQAQRREQQQQQRLAAAGVTKSAFDRACVALLSPQELAQALLRDEQGNPCYRISVISQRFDPPSDPYEVVDIQGEPCWRFVARTNKKAS